MNDSTMHIVFSGGGTGGHLFPGLAIADELRRASPEVQITFAGGGGAFERDHVSRSGYDYVRLASRPLPRGPWQAVRFFKDHLAGCRTAKRYLRQQHVSAVVGLGGYTSVPMARAAIARGIPLILIEQNAYPGRANAWLARSASLVCTAFASTRPHLRTRCPVRVTGTPTRQASLIVPRVVSRPRQLLVLGGSQGARALNQYVPKALYRLRGRLSGWRIIHQSGPREFEATRELYRKLACPAQVVPFIDDLPELLARTDVAVSRAGGGTIAELATAGVPALLLPYPHAADDHQRKNADALAATDAAVVVDAREVRGRLDYRVADELAALLDVPGRMATMATAMRRHARPDAAWNVANMVSDLCRAPLLAHAN
ncbi:MAG: UDP-N-acetylglucosamine--N-acetylmuramyl-(pentapeptide) pyrophosphoryl-undecaprenol N-acetylglucosamine transferase [Planctomycetaceae bacterium]|nr:UDP-N-acetylglucosamine--N-acetylmuramyl-(pentapeptide) pyrophosphoryl-undecaprenol N-acetylglucosamine transferase [Planctomycetaceae bacterium]